MIIIEPRYKRGSGILGDIFSSITKAGVKNAIKKAASSAAAHKIADAVVEGTAAGTKRYLEKKIAGPSESPRKKFKIDYSHLVNGSGTNHLGSGIVLD